MGYNLSDYEDYIIKGENITDASIAKHLEILSNFGNDLVDIDDWVLFLQEEQKTSLNRWLKYLNESEIREDLKQWILTSVLKMSNLNRDTFHFRKRDKHTIHPFAEINETALEKSISEKSGTITFRKIYAQNIADLLNQKSNDGKWVIYHGTNDADNLVNDLQGYFTRCCFASYNSAFLHLLAGDVHVYFTNINGLYIYPRVAVQRQMTGKEIAIGLKYYQGIEEELKSVANNRLKSLNR